MKIPNISFGKKIPLAKCQIQNKTTGEYTPATFYEVDCKDEEDYKEIKRLSVNWKYKYHIEDNMETKHLSPKSNLFFYQIRGNNDKLLAMSQVEESNGIYDVNYISREPNCKYRYVGQTMLACIGREVNRKKGDRLVITRTTSDARPFYTDICGFEELGTFMLKMNNSQIAQFINQTEEKTKSPIETIMPYKDDLSGGQFENT